MCLVLERRSLHREAKAYVARVSCGLRLEIGVLRAPLLRSGREVPRSDSGRAAARAGLKDAPRPSFERFALNSNHFGTRRSLGGTRNDSPDHPGTQSSADRASWGP
jgi:hypothetical protein